MSRTRTRRPVLTVVGVLLATALSGCTYVLDANFFTVVDAQEESFFSDGDEPYLATISFRVKPGVAGSTSVHYLGNLQELAGGAEDGDVLAIPDAMGRSVFEDVIPIGLDHALAGHSPEVIGIVTVAVESDLTSWSAINGIMGDVEDELDAQLRSVVESMTFADIVSGGEAAARLEQVAVRVQQAAEPTFWESVALFFGSLFDPDDVIGFNVLLFAAVDGTLAPFVDAAFSSGLPATVTARAWATGPVDLTYSGDGATYRVRVDAESI